MDVETFTNNVAFAHNKCSTEIKEGLVSIFAAEEQNIRQRLTEIIKEFFPDFQIWKISNILDESFETFKDSQNSIGEAISEKVEAATKSAIRMSSKMSVNRVSSAFSTAINELPNDNSLNKIEVQGAEMIKKITDYLKREEVNPAFIDERKIFDIVLEVNVKLAEYVSSLVKRIKKSSQNLLYENLEGYVQDIISRIEEYIEKSALDITTKVNLATALDRAGYAISVEEASLILTEKENNKRYELEKKDDNTYVTTDESITIVDDNEIRLKKGSSLLTIGDKTICVGTEADPYHMIISQDREENFEIYYNTIQENDLIKEGLIIDEINNLWPGVINNLEKNPAFRKVREHAKLEKDSNSKLFKDDNGIIRISEAKKKELFDLANILGFEVTNDELGVYLERNGEKHKINYENSLVTFENDSNISIALDLYIVGKFDILGPLFKYTDSKPGVTLIVNQDFTHLSLHIRNNAYLIDYNDEKASFNMMKAGKTVENNPIIQGEVEGVFEEYMPNALKYFNEKYIIPNIKRPSALHPLDELELDHKIIDQVDEPKISDELGYNNVDQVDAEQILDAPTNVSSLISELEDDINEEIGPEIQGNALPAIIDNDEPDSIINLLEGDPTLVDEIGKPRLGK